MDSDPKGCAPIHSPGIHNAATTSIEDQVISLAPLLLPSLAKECLTCNSAAPVEAILLRSMGVREKMLTWSALERGTPRGGRKEGGVHEREMILNFPPPLFLLQPPCVSIHAVQSNPCRSSGFRPPKSDGAFAS
jgi:hypothetical protein